MTQRALRLSFLLAFGLPALASSQTLDTQASVPAPAPAPAVTGDRPVPLMPLYAGFAVTQALDIHSTRLAVERGGRERNPLLKALHADRTWAAVAVKASLTGATIWTAEHLWKRRRRTSAVVLMVGVTALQGAVDAHNYRVAARLR